MFQHDTLDSCLTTTTLFTCGGYSKKISRGVSAEEFSGLLILKVIFAHLRRELINFHLHYLPGSTRAGFLKIAVQWFAGRGDMWQFRRGKCPGGPRLHGLGQDTNCTCGYSHPHLLLLCMHHTNPSRTRFGRRCSWKSPADLETPRGQRCGSLHLAAFISFLHLPVLTMSCFTSEPLELITSGDSCFPIRPCFLRYHQKAVRKVVYTGDVLFHLITTSPDAACLLFTGPEACSAFCSFGERTWMWWAFLCAVQHVVLQQQHFPSQKLKFWRTLETRLKCWTTILRSTRTMLALSMLKFLRIHSEAFMVGEWRRALWDNVPADCPHYDVTGQTAVSPRRSKCAKSPISWSV